MSSTVTNQPGLPVLVSVARVDAAYSSDGQQARVAIRLQCGHAQDIVADTCGVGLDTFLAAVRVAAVGSVRKCAECGAARDALPEPARPAEAALQGAVPAVEIRPEPAPAAGARPL